MIIDGRAIAAELLASVKSSVAAIQRPLRLSIITVAPTFATQKYLAHKQRQTTVAGIAVNVIELMADSDTTTVIEAIAAAAHHADGLVVQLPLPAHIDTDAVLAAVPPLHDVDVIHYDGTGAVLPPVVGAIATIAQQYNITFYGQSVTIIGAGRLVGAPAALWAAGRGARVTNITSNTAPADAAAAIAAATIIITGAGDPHFITPDMVQPGVIVFDAGTAESSGALAGDVHPDCAALAALITPVPGGIGPITISYLLYNLTQLAASHSKY